MIDRETAARLGVEYPWASWAIWDKAFPEKGCIECTPNDIMEFILTRSDQLNPSVVLLGLNRSSDLDAPFQNFHAATRRHYDYRLKEFIQERDLDRLHGAYMTDLVDEVNPDEAGVTLADEDVDVFLNQLEELGRSEYHILCFGDKPFRALIEYFDIDANSHPHQIEYTQTEVDGVTLHLYRVWFYGAWGANQDKVKILKDQLEYLNETIG